MAPGLTDTLPTPAHQLRAFPSKEIFPDGIKTSGQHAPLYNELRPFEDFPDEITAPTLWKSEDYAHNPERWTHVFTEDEIAEMSEAANRFLAAKTPLTGITKVSPQKHGKVFDTDEEVE